jgi:CRISPR type III-A-associated protein Csm2
MKAKSNNDKDLYTRYLLLYPKLAYAAGRQRSEALTTFKEVFEKAYRTINTEEDFKKYYKNLVDFIESTLAFHRSFGGR